jgi:hypothetical protein
VTSRRDTTTEPPTAPGRRSARVAVAALAIAAGGPAWGVTVVVQADIAGGDLSRQAVESTLWHALWEQQGHDAMFLPPGQDPSPVMHAQHLSTLYRVSLRWDPLVYDVEGVGSLAGMAPSLQLDELVLREGELRLTNTWITYGTLALYASGDGADAQYVSLPEVAMQGVARRAAATVSPAVWGEHTELLTLPITLAADDEYRAFYGAAWSTMAERRIARANALLRAAGVELVPVGFEAWESPDGTTDLSRLLEDLAREPHPIPGTTRVAFTQQAAVDASWAGGVEDVGRTHQPGREVLVADQALIPGQALTWDEADEGVAVAHEVLHSLGVPHVAAPFALMSATKVTTSHAMTEATASLARTALLAQRRHWDHLTAADALADAASAWLDDPDVQLDYVIHNLEAGLGMPAPGSVPPDLASALTNAAISRYYVQQARRGAPGAAALRASAILHAVTALDQDPGAQHTSLVHAVLVEARDVVVAAGPPELEHVTPLDESFAPLPAGQRIAP